MRLYPCDRHDRIAAAVIFVGVLAVAHLLDWLLTGHVTFGFWR